MELIQRIKDAERQAREIIEQARKDAAGEGEKVQSEMQEQLKEAQRKRHQVIEQAAEQAEKDTAADVESLIQQGQKDIEDLNAQAQQKMDKCVNKIYQNFQN